MQNQAAICRLAALPILSERGRSYRSDGVCVRHHVYMVRRGCYRRGKRRPWAESARRRVECRPKSVLMPKVLTSLSDRGRCNRNNNSNSNNHATAPRRYELIALLAIKASLVCLCVFLPDVSEGRKGTVNHIYIFTVHDE